MSMAHYRFSGSQKTLTILTKTMTFEMQNAARLEAARRFAGITDELQAAYVALAFVFCQKAFTNANRNRRDFNQFIIVDKLNR